MIKSLVSIIAVLGSLASGSEVRRLLQAFPAQPAEPSTPSTPGTGGGSGLPVQTMPPIINIIPTFPGPNGGPITKIQCPDPCTTSVNCPSTCAMTTEVVENPPNNFVMECSAPGSCAASSYTFNWEAGGVTKYMNSIKVGSAYALYGSTITLQNFQAQSIKLITIECSTGHCAQASFVLHNVYIGDLKCDEYIGCGSGCTVAVDGAAPVSCDSVSTT